MAGKHIKGAGGEEPRCGVGERKAQLGEKSKKRRQRQSFETISGVEFINFESRGSLWFNEE